VPTSVHTQTSPRAVVWCVCAGGVIALAGLHQTSLGPPRNITLSPGPTAKSSRLSQCLLPAHKGVLAWKFRECLVHCTAHCLLHRALPTAPHCLVHCLLHCTALHYHAYCPAYCTALHCIVLYCTRGCTTALYPLHCTCRGRAPRGGSGAGSVGGVSGGAAWSVLAHGHAAQQLTH
jgi:hypothetical protein